MGEYQSKFVKKAREMLKVLNKLVPKVSKFVTKLKKTNKYSND